MCFHPLKAGRRHERIPPRKEPIFAFPSPQGGSETRYRCVNYHSLYEVSIPSRRVGDWAQTSPTFVSDVSIPSRRVGDIHKARGKCHKGSSFHPLKAGRRLLPCVQLEQRGERFHPLKAGRRPRGNEGKGGQKKAKGREGCRRPSVGGKS